MGLIYINGAQVVEYKIFGIYMHAVERAEIDYENMSVSIKNFGWFYNLFDAIDCLQSVRNGEAK